MDLLTFRLFIVFVISLDSIIPMINAQKEETRSSEEPQLQMLVWEMVKAFGEECNAKDWIIHYDQNSNWKNTWSNIVKTDQYLGYFAGNEIPSNETSKWIRMTKEIKLHLYVGREFEVLNSLIKEEINSIISQPPELEITGNIASNWWLIQMPDNSDKNTIKQLLSNTPFRYDTMSYAFTMNLDDSIDIYDVYKIAAGSETVLQKYGTWSVNFGLQIFEDDVWTRRRSLEGHHIRVAAPRSPPVVVHIEENCDKKECFRGMFADTFHALSLAMNFTFTIKRAYQWGAFVNGEWNGMVGMLIKDEIDIAPADLTVTRSRSTAVDFLPSLMASHEQLFLKNPADGLVLNAYAQPLTVLSWLGIALYIALIPPVLAAIVIYSNDENAEHYGLGGCYICIAKTLIMLGNTYLPCKSSSRIAFTTIFIGGIIIYYYWEAMLISYLAVRKIELPFRTLEELDKTNFKVIAPQGTSLLDQFVNAKNPLYMKIGEEKLKPYLDEMPLVPDTLSAALNEPNSVAYGETAFKSMDLYLNCKVIDTGVVLQTNQIAWAIPKHSPYYWSFRSHIDKLKEIGAVDKYAETYSGQGQVCPDYSGRPVTATQCFTAFLALVVGMVLGLLWLILELAIPRSWMKAILTMGNQKFEQLLLAPSSRDKSKSHLNGNGTMNWKDSDMFVNRSRKDLMDKIVSHAGNEYQLHGLIVSYYKAFVETKEYESIDEESTELEKAAIEG